MLPQEIFPAAVLSTCMKAGCFMGEHARTHSFYAIRNPGEFLIA